MESEPFCSVGVPVNTEAVQHVRRMRGGAQSHLLRCSDGNFYVVKFRNNPQHVRILANEMFATGLARRIGLPVPATAVVEVSEALVKYTQELCIQQPHSIAPCQPGLHFGSRYAIDPLEGQVFDYLPVERLESVRNRETFAGMLALDKWTGNADGRQAAFWRRSREQRYSVTFIDQGHCFNGGEWNFPDFPDYPLRGVYARSEVYRHICGWESFEPWLSRIEKMDPDLVWSLAENVPSQWYSEEWDRLANLVRSLLLRREMLRGLIEQFRGSQRGPFPNWKRGVTRKRKSRPRVR